MCLKEEICKPIKVKNGVKKHYEQFGKWKHGLQRHFLSKNKRQKEI